MNKPLSFAAVLLAVAVCAAVGSGASAQDAPLGAEAEPTDEALFDADELDALVAPVALFPDALLAQIFLASTSPIEVVKAERFLAGAVDLSDDDRAMAIEAEGWDPSVAVLAAGFPTVLERMAADLDWTEDVGDAMFVQTDDLLDAVQRMRARAQATGYLASNDAQVVDEADGVISVAPADPQVIYVPRYDPGAAYLTAPTAAPIYETVDDGLSATDVITTGAIAFGSALLIDELFDNDDDNNDNDDWDDYWRHEAKHFDWDDSRVYGRRDVNIDGDVNINRIDADVRRAARKIGDRDPGVAALRRDSRPGREWSPSAAQRREARERIEARKRTIGDGARPGATDRKAALDRARGRLEAGRDGAGGGAREKLEAAAAKREPREKRQAGQAAFKPRSGDAAEVRKAKDRAQASLAARSEARPAAKPKVTRPAADRPAAKTTAFKPGKDGAAGTRRAIDRGAVSAARAGAKPKVAARPKGAAQPKAAARSHNARPKAKRQPPQRSAFKPSGGGKAKAAAHRGGKSGKKKRG